MIGSKTLVNSVSGLRESRSRSRRMIAHDFFIACPPVSAPRRPRHPEGQIEEATLARRLIAQTPPGEAEEDVLQGDALELNRRDLGAGFVELADQLRHRVRTVIERDDDRATLIKLDLVDVGLRADHRDRG